MNRLPRAFVPRPDAGSGVRPAARPDVEAPPAPEPSSAFVAPAAPVGALPREPLVSISNEGSFELERVTPLLPETPSGERSRRDRASLVRMNGPTAGEPIVLANGAVTLGRGRGAEIAFDDEGVSRLHASIRHEAGDYVLTDLGSRNGTTVDGRSVDRHVLADGDVIRLGPRSALRFTLTDDEGDELIRHLYRSSTSDLLTGAFNRRHFDERFAAEVAYAARHRTQLGLLMFDLDHFKRVNDSFGHAAGDAILRHVAALVTARLRVEDVFARYGGEEFVVLLRNIDVAGAGRAAERLRAATAATRPVFRGSLIPVTISVGCATLAECEIASCASLLELADRRLYRSKSAGRNRVTTTG